MELFFSVHSMQRLILVLFGSVLHVSVYLLFLPSSVIFSSSLFAASITADAPSVAAKAAVPQLHFQSAQQCAECHREIYREWQLSWMARAFTNPVFQQDYLQWQQYARQQGDDPVSCLRCHAPVATLSSDIELKNEVSREGVTCTVCHKVALVREREGRHYLVMDPRQILYGASGKSQSKESKAAHEIRNSAALSDSTLCAGCHLDLQADGTPLEYTYHEWKNSAFAKAGTQCMDCHMPVTQPSIMGKTRKPYRSHRFEGGHSESALLTGAAGIELDSIDTSGRLQMTVSNLRAGHNFPTGGAHPSRLILNVELTSAKGEVLFQETRNYEFTYLNKDGNPVTARDAVTGWQDTGLKPNETRTEVFSLPPLLKEGSLSASLRYELIPPAMADKLPQEEQKHYRPVLIAEVKKSLAELLNQQ